MKNQKHKPIKYKISDIELSTIQKQKLENTLNNKNIANYTKFQILKQLCGTCCVCYGVPKKLVSYKRDDCIQLERYCEPCFDKHKNRLIK
jgi:hypothetical protein